MLPLTDKKIIKNKLDSCKENGLIVDNVRMSCLIMFPLYYPCNEYKQAALIHNTNTFQFSEYSLSRLEMGVLSC